MLERQPTEGVNMTTFNNPHDALRHHVSGAIARGESQPVVEQRGPTKSQILALLRAHIESRPGLEFCNYGDVAAYRSEQRRIARQKRDALTLLRAVEWRDSLTAEHLIPGFRAFSGRLTLETLPDGRHKLDYCTGQYYPTEYRAAAAAVLASALWTWACDCAMPAPYAWRVESYGKWNGDKFEHERSRPLPTRGEAQSVLIAKGGQAYGGIFELYRDADKLLQPGEWLRTFFRREFGAAMQRRYFN
jgi:hypothetical protein